MDEEDGREPILVQGLTPFKCERCATLGVQEINNGTIYLLKMKSCRVGMFEEYSRDGALDLGFMYTFQHPCPIQRHDIPLLNF